jgi:hypothetical protein
MSREQRISEELALAVVEHGEEILKRAQAVARKVETQVQRVLGGEPPAANRTGVEPPGRGTKPPRRRGR